MNAYLIVSESFRLIDEQIEKIVKNNPNIIKFDMQEESIEDLINEAAYISLLNDPKFIIAKNANFFGSSKIKEEDSNKLLSYLNNPNPQSTIIFTLNTKLDERKKITKLMKEKYQIIEIAKLNEYDMNKKVSNLLKENGYKVDFETVRYITKSCLVNYDLIYNEIEKIKLCYLNQKDLTFEDIKAIVSPSIEDNVFKFINAIVEKNTRLMFKYFKDLKILKEEPIAFISLLAREYRNMYLIKTQKKNKSQSELMKLLNIQKWQYDKHEKYAYEYSEKELKEKLRALLKLDTDIKTGKIDKYLGFELFLLNI